MRGKIAELKNKGVGHCWGTMQTPWRDTYTLGQDIMYWVVFPFGEMETDREERSEINEWLVTDTESALAIFFAHHKVA